MSTVAERPARRDVGPRRRIAAQTAMELRLLARNGENLLVTLGIPTGLLVCFSLVDVLPTDGRPAVEFLLPGVLAVAVMGSAMVSLAIATGFERAYLVLKRLGATPLRRGELVAAKGLAVGATVVVQTAVLLGVGAALGWRPPPGRSLAVAGAAGAVALVLGATAFAGIGLALAGRLRALATLALANALFVVLLLTSGAVFPLDALPPGPAAAARLLPAGALVEALRAAAEGTVAGRALAVLGVWAVTAPLVAARTFRWD